MSKSFECNICDKKFNHKLVKDFHTDFKHNIISYSCELCDKPRFINYNQTSLLNLLDHIYKSYDETIYHVLDVLNIY